MKNLIQSNQQNRNAEAISAVHIHPLTHPRERGMKKGTSKAQINEGNAYQKR